MLPNEILQLLVQAPIIVAFIWYSLESQKQAQAALKQATETNAAAIRDLAAKIEALAEQLARREN